MAMTRCTHLLHTLLQLTSTLLPLLYDGMHGLGLRRRPSLPLAAENLFLRKQLALYHSTTSLDITHLLRSTFFAGRGNGVSEVLAGETNHLESIQ